MKISYQWLQGYFEEKLPEPAKLAERITFSFAEVESIERMGEDTMFDIKVLPDRACYALSHRGVAYEVAAMLGIPKKEMNWPQPEVKKVRPLEVRVEAPRLCIRYMARVIENVTQKAEPWTKKHLEALGQRMINSIVDGANLVMFDMGQPLHTFDADKVEGGIIVRMAKKGERITTLDNRDVELDEGVLVIADHKAPLAIAGIKGGKKAEVTAATKNIIIESANFDAPYIRKTSERLGIKTDASKRYENKLSPEYASIGMRDFTAYLFELGNTISAGEIIDHYPKKPLEKNIVIKPQYLSEKLGVKISPEEAGAILNRLLITTEKRGKEWILTPPLFRVDLLIPEDIAEEVGRIIGYDKIHAELPPKAGDAFEIPKEFLIEWKIREILLGVGFSEIMTSSFGATGEVAIVKPLAEDKKYARASLRPNFEKALAMNKQHAQLFGSEEIKIFEIGKVFPKTGEHTALSIGYAGPKKKIAESLNTVVELLSQPPPRGLGTPFTKGEVKDGIVEINLDALNIAVTREPWNITIPPAQQEKFKAFSLHPFITRDIALFVPSDTNPEEIIEIIKNEGTDLMVKGPTLFDDFTKEGKRSLAFRMIFQSMERTLSDDEVNAIMEKIYVAVKAKGWTVR